MLVKCPECGKENVSDSAEACPDCGYGIKSYFEEIKQEELRIESIRKAEKIKIQEEINNIKREENRIKSVPKPLKPIFSRGLIVYMIIATMFGSWLFLYTPTTYGESPDIGTLFFELLFFVGLPFLIYYFSYYSKAVTAYKLAKIDFEAYQRQVIQEQNKAWDNAQAAAATRAREEAMKPECPYCHSHNTTKITATTKVVNTAMFGIFGQKRKHQWHCNSCKSDF